MKCQIIFCSVFMEWHYWTRKRPVLHLQKSSECESLNSVSDPNLQRIPHVPVVPYPNATFRCVSHNNKHNALWIYPINLQGYKVWVNLTLPCFFFFLFLLLAHCFFLNKHDNFSFLQLCFWKKLKRTASDIQSV